MGAEVFWCKASGKDARDAYKNAVEDALYDCGHGGYTGTIAEKSGFYICEAPKRISANKFAQWVEQYDTEMAGGKKTKVPKKYLDLIVKANRVFEDKWGPAVCIPLQGKELKEWRKQFCNATGKKYTTRKFYLFIGWASS